MKPCIYEFLQYDKCLSQNKDKEKCNWIYHYLKACYKYN